PRPPNVDEFSAELEVVGQFIGPVGVWTFLTLWLLYGFGVAQLCAMAFRKTPVAIVVAVLLSNLGAMAWLPSIVGGGLPTWEVFFVPALLLATTRLLYWTWPAGYLYSFRPCACLTAGGGAGSLWTSGGL